MKLIAYLAIAALAIAIIGNMLTGCVPNPTDLRIINADQCYDANGNDLQGCPPLRR